MKSCSILSFSSRIWPFRWEPYLKVIQAATTGLLIPHALPSTAFEGTKQYWMFFYSQLVGNVIIISKGSQSAARIKTSTWLLVIYLRTSLTPFLICLRGRSCWTSSQIFLVSLASAKGSGLSSFYSIVVFSFGFSSEASNKLMNYCFSSLIAWWRSRYDKLKPKNYYKIWIGWINKTIDLL